MLIAIINNIACDNCHTKYMIGTYFTRQSHVHTPQKQGTGCSSKLKIRNYISQFPRHIPYVFHQGVVFLQTRDKRINQTQMISTHHSTCTVKLLYLVHSIFENFVTLQ